MKRAALVPCRGLGDGVIMTIAAKYLKEQGYEVTIYHTVLMQLSSWLPDFKILPDSSISFDYDRILYQNENDPRAKMFYNHPKVEILYHNWEETKHPPIRKQDFYIGTEGPIAKRLAAVLGMPCDSPTAPPIGLTHRKFAKRVAIHPTSADPKRNWPRKKFLALSKLLEARGFDPYFVMSARERIHWGVDERVPIFESLEETSAFLYESGSFIGNDSGIGHLASALKIPTLTLSNRKQHISLWRPSFTKNGVVLPPSIFPRYLRETKWKNLIIPKNVFHKFLQLSSK